MFSLILACALTFTHATTPEELSWGLMDTQELPENQGMLFHFPTKERRSFWMFNCYFDLDLAFLDDDGTILEIHTMKAYPEKMDPERPVHCLDDLSQYPPGDPIVRFFTKQATHSKHPARYALEVPAGTLEGAVGDRIPIP